MACRPTNKMCFNCGEWFKEEDAEYCYECTEWKCSLCGACGCSVAPSVLFAVRAIVKTYETWLEEEDINQFCVMEENIICHGCGDCDL